MPRALAVRDLSPQAGVEELRRRRDAARQTGAHYWAFREIGSVATLTEFIEAADEAAVRVAAAAVDQAAPAGLARFLLAVEL